jgi:hypothetical protein
MGKKASFFSSIRTQLIILVLTATLPALGAVTYSGMELQRKAIKAAHTEALMAIRSTAFQHERTLETTRQLLSTLSGLEEIQALKATESDRPLKKMLDNNPMLANLPVARLDGQVISSALPFTPLNVGHRKYFTDVTRTRRFLGRGICNRYHCQAIGAPLREPGL